MLQPILVNALIFNQQSNNYGGKKEEGRGKKEEGNAFFASILLTFDF
ncbi:MAG: hypothetical protein F6K17_03660 [Okeania sp. SIO3C4]|nr:hypothetical protein [Okeania sp. SIO3B3]NER01790.1 hypothetical protein [Okeania sp. SIO3C4]